MARSKSVGKKPAVDEQSVEEQPVVFEGDPPENPPTKKPTVYEQVERNLNVVADKMRGDTWPVICSRYGISIRRGKAILAEYRAQHPTLRHHDPVEVVDELLEGYMTDIVALNETYDKAKDEGNTNGRIGAVNARMAARARVAELLQAIGVLPHDLGTMHLVIEGQVTAEKVMQVLERYELPDEIFAELERAFGIEDEIVDGEVVGALPERTG